MSPDIEWHVGEDAEHETIVRTAHARRSRRSLWAVLVTIGLGASLGLLYRSIPEPPPKPIDPAPIPAVVQSPLSPLPAPQTLAAAIERDALRLASLSDTTGVTFDPALSQVLPAYSDWYAALQNAGGSWVPITPLTPYTVFETGTLPDGAAWVKLGQFRNGDFFRHMRFYRWHDDQWIWVLPDPDFWSGPLAEAATGDASPIGPVSILHPIADAPVVGAVLDRFTRAYLNLCESLKCPRPAASSAVWTPGLTVTIAILPQQTEATVQERRNATLHIELPTPRIVGYFEDPNGAGDPFVAMAYATLIDPIVRLASGDHARWETDRGGELFLQAIAAWKREKVRQVLQPSKLFYPPAPGPSADGPAVSRKEYADRLRYESRPPLVSLWDWPTQGRGFGLLQHVAADEAEAVVAFITDQYGEDGVVAFLNALGSARSLEEAIEAALPVSFGEFNRQWVRWIAGE